MAGSGEGQIEPGRTSRLVEGLGGVARCWGGAGR